MKSLHPPTFTKQASTIRDNLSSLTRRLRRETDSGSLTFAQVLLLSRISRLEPFAWASTVAELEGVRPQNLSVQLADLEQRDLITRKKDHEDKRKVAVFLTKRGTEVLLENRSQRDQWLAQAMETNLNKQEVALLLEASQLMARLAQCEDK